MFFAERLLQSVWPLLRRRLPWHLLASPDPYMGGTLLTVPGLTAHLSGSNLQRFVQAGLEGLLLKPFEVECLCAEVERLTQQSICREDLA